jgi:small subunit ribosomal protein S11
MADKADEKTKAAEPVATEPKAAGEVAEVKESRPSQPQTAEEVFLALEGGEEKVRILRAKGSKNVFTGVVHVLATYNNTKVTVTDLNGNVIGWSSSGKMGFRGSRKSTAYAAQLVSQDACRQAMGHGLRSAEVRVKGPGAGRESAVRAVQNIGVDITVIRDVTPVPHNGCRPKKARRV